MRNDKLMHFDAWGNPILDRLSMIGYYRSNPFALKIVKEKLPHQYIVIPNVYLDINPMDLSTITMVLMFPRKDVYKELHLSERAIQGLRNVYLGKKKGWTHRITKYGHTVLEKTGTVLIEKAGKFGVQK